MYPSKHRLSVSWKRLCREHGTAVMLITHDMGVIAETADRVAVMYAGRLVEIGEARKIQNAKHPYTLGLMGSIPTIGDTEEDLRQIQGSMPRLAEILRDVPSTPGVPTRDRCERIVLSSNQLMNPVLPAGFLRTKQSLRRSGNE